MPRECKVSSTFMCGQRQVFTCMCFCFCLCLYVKHQVFTCVPVHPQTTIKYKSWGCVGSITVCLVSARQLRVSSVLKHLSSHGSPCTPRPLLSIDREDLLEVSPYHYITISVYHYITTSFKFAEASCPHMDPRARLERKEPTTFWTLPLFFICVT